MTAADPTPVPARDALLEQLAGVFLSRGYEGATLSELARAAGLSKASLYHHFPGGKAEMAAVLLRTAVATLQRDVFSQLLTTSDPAQGLAELIDAFGRYVAAGGGHCLVAVLAQGSVGQQHGRLIAAQYRDWLSLLASRFEALGAKPKRAQREAAEFLAILYGLVLSARLLGDPDHLRRGLKRQKRRFAPAAA
jgi:AcrR family transcriptional regulator